MQPTTLTLEPNGDFPSTADARKIRTAELAEQAIGIARCFGAHGEPLVELVQWISAQV